MSLVTSAPAARGIPAARIAASVVDVVHMERPVHPPCASIGSSRSRNRRLVVAIPQHDALAGRLVDQNHGELVLGVAVNQVRDVDVAAS